MNRMFVTLILVFAAQFVFAQEVRENYNGIRMMSMGGAGIGVVNDETALLTNPAGLGKLRDVYGTIIDPEFEITGRANDFYKTKAFTDPFDLQQIKDTTMATRNINYHAKAQLFPSFVVRNFGIGLNAKRVVDAKMNAAGTQMDTFYQEDVSVVMGINLRFFDGRIKIGAVGKATSRIEINKVLDPTGSLDVQANASEGVGFGTDVGIILSAPIVWLPSIAVTMRDIGGTRFDGGSGFRFASTTRPTPVEQDTDVAIALFPIHSNRSRSQFTIQMDKLKEMSLAIDKTRYYHAGYEFNYADIFFLRAGLNQRYWTAGMEFASEHTQFQIGSYGEDVGVDSAPVEDRRYMFKFALRF